MERFNYDNIEITNDFMFGYVMSDPERCKLFLEQILDVQIDHVEYLEKQKTIDIKIDARSVRLDIYMSDGETIYNVEMQTSFGKNLPKRSRYYQGQIDMNLITKGENYTKLKKSFVIFICTFDPFGQNRYIYSFENICKGDILEDDILLQDGTYKIFINTKGTKGNVSDDFKELMDYFNDSEVVINSKNPLVHSIDSAVKTARNNEEWRHDYMTWKMYGNEKYEEGKEEGRQEGRREGRQEERKETAVRMFVKGMDIKLIAELVGETEETVEQWLKKE